MMYQIFCDKTLIYDTRIDELKLINPKLELELNKVNKCEFDIYPTHRNFGDLKKMKSLIEVFQDGKKIFHGRILNDEQGFYKQKKVLCEGELAFLNDSVQRPYEFQGDVSELFNYLISEHNKQVDADKQFKVGQVTVTDPNNYINRSDTQYLTTWESINQKLITPLGGYLISRYETDGIYLDYLADINLLNGQQIELKKNLLDIKKTVKGEQIATVIVPLGARITPETPETPETVAETPETAVEEKRVDITSVNNGKDYVEDLEGISKYGRITKVLFWDDVTEPANLLRKANEELGKKVLFDNTIEITAADLAGTGQDIASFSMAYVKIISDLHELNDNYLIKKMSLNLDNPSQDKLVVGTQFSSLIDQNKAENEGIKETIKTEVGNTSDRVTAELEKEMASIIEQTAASIKSEVAENYYLKGDADELIKSINTQFEQTKNSFEFTFSQFEKNLEDTQNNTSSRFSEIEKYIRFIDGNIVLGEKGNQLELKIQNDRISFLQNNAEVAYFTNRKLYVTDGEFIHGLRLGNFEFQPRENGNLSFVKVGG